MVLPPPIRRQRPGVKVQQTTITLPGNEMERLRKEAYAQRITVSLHVVNLIRAAWAAKDEEESAA